MSTKRRGRPTVDPAQGSTRVKLTVSNAVYDRTYDAARAQRVKVGDVMRDAIDRYLRARATGTK